MRVGKITAVLAAAAVAAFASSAAAQEFSLSPSPTITGGSVTFSATFFGMQQSLPMNCTVSATLVVAGGTGSSTANLASPSISPNALPGSNPACGLLIYPITPWSAQTIYGEVLPSGGYAKVIVRVGANTIANDPCPPQNVVVPLSTPSGGGPSTITFTNVALYSQSGTRQCLINGVLTATGMTNNRVFIH